MAISIPSAYIETFENTVRQLAQQNNSRLRSCVTEVNKQSEKHNWDRLAASTARAKTSARMVSPAGGNGSGGVGDTDGLTWTRRNTTIAAYDTGEVIEQENIVQMLIDPKSASTENLVMNMQRQVDDIVIAAALGAAGDGAGGTSALPAGQIIGDYSTEISLDFILEVDELYYANDVDPDEPRYIVIGPKQRRKLLQLIEVTSSDFQSRQALATGYLPDFLGFNWIISNRLNVPLADQLDCFSFTKKGLGLHVAGDISTRVAERADMSFAWQVYLMMQMASVRVEDEHVVHMKLADTVT
ncbi:MAG: hypothetical protein DRQ39_08550 [Gammaproteobacteria bacterium]|nr:MAG: hypothetical protein DRQ39_08550 [Gammaproteobacteria bacterium]RKZ98151.1 MAG: hypothetical protein DRQ42_08980 [Gammaproteobacteria bacterium]